MDTHPTLRLRCCAVSLPPTLDAQLLAILDRPLDPAAPPASTFDRKERDLVAVFDALSPDDAHAIYARLVINYADDALARKFGRLSECRRTRLLELLFTLCEDP